MLQHKVRGKPFPLFKPLSVAELHIAERTLITHTQHEHFPGCFVSNKLLPRYLKKLQPIVIDGVLRVVGRLSHSLFDLSDPNLPPGLFSSEDCYSRRRWAQIQFLANQYWRRWMNEFVPNLLQRQKWFQERKTFCVNDVVLLVEDTQQRSKWVMGRILETNPDKRGFVRTVLVKTPTNVVKRPIAKLCPVVTNESSSVGAS